LLSLRVVRVANILGQKRSSSLSLSFRQGLPCHPYPRGRRRCRARSRILRGWLVEGLIWGRETLWFDGRRNLVGAVTLDAEFDHFETVPGHSLHREIELYVRAGFTPMEAIQAATIVPARVMGVDKETGTVGAGKRADLIVIDGDPLADIRNTRNVELVVTGGEMYNSADLWRGAGFKPWMKNQAAQASGN